MLENPVPIKLKYKYSHGFPAKQQKSEGGRSGKNKRHKLTAAEKKRLAPQKIMVLNASGGKRKFEFREFKPYA